MKLKTQLRETRHHKQIVNAVCWTPENEVLACSDDQTISLWNSDGELVEGSVCKLDTYVTDMAYCIQAGGGKGAKGSDFFAISGTDGSVDSKLRSIGYDSTLNSEARSHSRALDASDAAALFRGRVGSHWLI